MKKFWLILLALVITGFVMVMILGAYDLVDGERPQLPGEAVLSPWIIMVGYVGYAAGLLAKLWRDAKAEQQQREEEKRNNRH